MSQVRKRILVETLSVFPISLIKIQTQNHQLWSNIIMISYMYFLKMSHVRNRILVEKLSLFTNITKLFT